MTEEMIKFIMYVTGLPRQTVLQLYEDWLKRS